MKEMSKITIPATTITPEQYSVNARQLVAAVMLQATRDYCQSGSEAKRNSILNDLRSPYMDFVSSGVSVVVAERLETHSDEITERLQKSCEYMI